jgi:uncharacterized protein YecE (DUF72 family)
VILIGTSGFDYDDWRGCFYPDDLPKRAQLEYYSGHFSALELNFSYYRLPGARQLASMVERTGGRVAFAVKAHRSMTHERTAGEAEYQGFAEALAPLAEAGALAAVLAQFPHSFVQCEENRSYLGRLADRLGPRLVFEPRGDEWIAGPVLDWLERRGIGLCCVDEPALPGLMPPLARATASPAYVRFHGRNAAKWYRHDSPHERYDWRYSARELAEWVPRVRALEDSAGKVLVFFNNHFQAKAVDAARLFSGMLGA